MNEQDKQAIKVIAKQLYDETKEMFPEANLWGILNWETADESVKKAWYEYAYQILQTLASLDPPYVRLAEQKLPDEQLIEKRAKYLWEQDNQDLILNGVPIYSFGLHNLYRSKEQTELYRKKARADIEWFKICSSRF
jgi:hypothetical protein